MKWQNFNWKQHSIDLAHFYRVQLLFLFGLDSILILIPYFLGAIFLNHQFFAFIRFIFSWHMLVTWQCIRNSFKWDLVTVGFTYRNGTSSIWFIYLLAFYPCHRVCLPDLFRTYLLKHIMWKNKNTSIIQVIPSRTSEIMFIRFLTQFLANGSPLEYQGLLHNTAFHNPDNENLQKILAIVFLWSTAW